MNEEKPGNFCDELSVPFLPKDLHRFEEEIGNQKESEVGPVRTELESVEKVVVHLQSLVRVVMLHKRLVLCSGKISDANKIKD